MQSSKNEEFAISTFNLRNGVFNDGRNGWANRRKVACNAFLKFPETRIICTQEGSSAQLSDFLEDLPGQWGRAGIGRENSGSSREEHCCIFYDLSHFESIDSGDFALSETPECLGSKSWNTACCRMCTWTVLKHRSSGCIFLVVNTHLDHVSEEARIKGCELIMDFVESHQDADAAFFCGDFNCPRHSRVWKRCTQRFQDAFQNAEKKVCKSLGTFHNFQGSSFESDCEEQHIDWILYADLKLQMMKVNHFEVCDHCEDVVDSGILPFFMQLFGGSESSFSCYPSDHYPVFATFEFSSRSS